MKPLSPGERRALRAAAHHLQPVVAISRNGLSDTVVKEVDRALRAHELIKVKLYGVERDQREAALAELHQRLECEAVQHIGNILVLWRPKPASEDEGETPRRRRKGKPLTKKQAAAALENKRRRRRP